MRPVASVIIVLLSALCACRSSRQAVVERADSAAITLNESRDSFAFGRFMSVVSAARELDLTDFSVEFFPPDSATLRPFPKAVTVGKAKSVATFDKAVSDSSVTTMQKSTAASAQSSSSTQESSEAVRGHPPDFRFAVLLLILIFAFTVFTKLRQK